MRAVDPASFASNSDKIFLVVADQNQEPKKMKGFVENIEKLTEENSNFRKVLYTAKSSQLVVMSLKPGEDIGLETHKLEQFLRIESGHGKCVLD